MGENEEVFPGKWRHLKSVVPSITISLPLLLSSNSSIKSSSCTCYRSASLCCRCTGFLHPRLSSNRTWQCPSNEGLRIGRLFIFFSFSPIKDETLRLGTSARRRFVVRSRQSNPFYTNGALMPWKFQGLPSPEWFLLSLS